jgi:hypothetical protein
MASTITAGNATNGLAIASDNTGALEIKTGSGAGTTAITISSAQAATFAGAVTAAAGFVGNASTATKLTTASGSAPSYSARAWVSFNGTGTIAIKSSGNVTSISDGGVGVYTVNLTTAIPTTTSACISASACSVGGTNRFIGAYQTTTTAIAVNLQNAGGTPQDLDYVSIAAFA